ncbi:hypothetical protein AGMMS4957_07790 [Bacteroidia bacterium]|nr:hypothetical protein AGMMS4957_07790 [Bacteroidia bacterium]
MQQNARDNGFTELKEVDAKTLNLGTAQGHYTEVTYIDFKKFYWTVIRNEITTEEQAVFEAFFKNKKLYTRNKRSVPFPTAEYDDPILKDLVNAAVGYAYSDKYSPGEAYKRIGLKIVAEAKKKAGELIKTIPNKFITWTTDGGYFEGYIPDESVIRPLGYDVTVAHFKDAYFVSNSGDCVMVDAAGEIAPPKGNLKNIYNMLKGAKDVAIWWGRDKDDAPEAKEHFILKRRKEGYKGNADWWDSVKGKIQITATDLNLPCSTPKDIASLFIAFDALLTSRKRLTDKTKIITEIIIYIKGTLKEQITKGVNGVGKVLIEDRLNGRIPHLYSYIENSTEIEGQYLSDKENSQILEAIHEHRNVRVVAPCGIGKSTSLLYIARSLDGLISSNKLVVFVPTQILAWQTVNTFRAEGIRSEYVTTGETQWFKEACSQSQVLIFTYGSHLAEGVIKTYCGDDSIIAFDERHTTNWFDTYDGIFRAGRGLNFKTIQLTATPLFGVEASEVKELRFFKNSLYKPTIDKFCLIKQEPTPDTKSLVKHIKKCWGMENRWRRLIVYVNNKMVISDCLKMLKTELPEAKTMGFYTNDNDKDNDYYDGVNTTGKERQSNIHNLLMEFEQGEGDIDILFTTQKGAEGHNFHDNKKDDCYIFVNDWNTAVQFAGRFRDGLRTLTLIGEFGGDDIKTRSCTARYNAQGLTYAERHGKEAAASNLLIRTRGMVVLPYVLREIYNIGEVVEGDADFDVAPKGTSLSFLQIVGGDMQEVMLGDLHKKRQKELLKAFADLCIVFDKESGVLANLSRLYAQVQAKIEGGADSNKVLWLLSDNLRRYGLLDNFAVPYVRPAFVTLAGGIYIPGTKGKRKGKAVGKAWDKPYPKEYLSFIAEGGEGDDVQKRYSGHHLKSDDIAALYANGGSEKMRKNLYPHSIYTNGDTKKFAKTMNTPTPPTTPPPPPPLPTIKVIKEPQPHTAANLLAGGYYGEVEAELYPKGLIPEDDFKDTLTGEPCPF